jgi:DNA polymerase-3 subunit epsilon/ATP-dependent DNA helicase DinG
VSPAYVALDLETTGLDAERDAIIEVGAVRFDLNGTHETFRTFVDPGRDIPYRIQCLTGIRDADVAGAPRFAEIASEIEAFIGDRPVIGQNPTFDLDFLARHLVRPAGPAYDTKELAALLLPELSEHGLRAIAVALGIDFPVQHRALEDAEAARMVFVALRERLAALPPALLGEAERIASITDWPLRHLLTEVADERPALLVGAEAEGLVHGAVRAPGDYGPAVWAAAAEAPEAIDAADVERALTTAARGVMDGFEERPEQVAMARAVAAAFNGNEHLIVEAGTGVGKSLAYLAPAAMHALRNDTRVVVSTNTINLQEQLIGQDLPALRRLLGDGAGDELRAAVLKGRRNYLCLLRWMNLRRSANLSSDEAKLLVRLLLWLPHTDTGDKTELNLSNGEEAIWSRLSAQNESCMAVQCPFVKDGSCFMLRARKRAESAHVLIVNHSLLLSDIVVGGGVIPDYERLIVDEAQHLEDEATDQFGFHATENDLITFLDRLHQPRATATRAGGEREVGLLTRIRNASRGVAGQLAETQNVLKIASEVAEAVERCRQRLPDFFMLLAGFVRQQGSGETDYDERLLLTRAMRVQPDWADVELAWQGSSDALASLLARLDDLVNGLQAPDAEALLDRELLVSDTTELLQTGDALRRGLDAVLLQEDAQYVCWLTQERASSRSGNGIGISSAPLRVADLLDDKLFSRKETVVLTSATLTAEGSFDYMRDRLGLSEAREVALGSPFDYANSTMVLVPRDMPEPSQQGYLAALQETLIELTRASRGRALVLFTSHAGLRAVYGGIKRPLEDEQILVLAHQLDGSPKQLIRTLREQPSTVVLGTASFWEGVDVVGEALSLLVIARLPFSVPTDPVFQSRSELFDDPFSQYAVPQAVLRFKQGFGRLIRRKTDRGAMVVLDRRIRSKAYGQSFLNSLPECDVHEVMRREMPGMVGNWLADRP